ncbi:hypothetical protein CDEF62S_02598 [Castellaniella defragrans]
MMDAAVAAGADCYVSGEISEPTVHLARETGRAYISAGHHATERYGAVRPWAPPSKRNSGFDAPSSTSTIPHDETAGATRAPLLLQ